jgi:hypothetical protein
MDLKDNRELSSFTSLVGVPAMVNLCKSKMVPWHNDFLEKEAKEQKEQFQALVGADVSEFIGGAHFSDILEDVDNDSEEDRYVPIGSNMGSQSTAGYMTKNQVVRGSNRPDVFDSESFRITRPGTCEDLLMRAQEPMEPEDYPTREEIADAINDMDEENHRTKGAVRAGTMVEVYNEKYEDLYHHYQYKTDEMDPFSEGCYIQDRDLVNYDDLGTNECDLELLQLLQSAQRTFGTADCEHKKDCPPTRPVTTTTTITTTSL